MTVSALAATQGRTRIVLDWRRVPGLDQWTVGNRFVDKQNISVCRDDSGDWHVFHHGQRIKSWRTDGEVDRVHRHSLEEAMLSAEAYHAQWVGASIRSCEAELANLKREADRLTKGVR